MRFINLGEAEHPKKKLVLDVQPPSVYKSHILNGQMNKLYIYTQSTSYKTFFMLISVEPEILKAHKYKNIKKFRFFRLR